MIYYTFIHNKYCLALLFFLADATGGGDYVK